MEEDGRKSRRGSQRVGWKNSERGGARSVEQWVRTPGWSCKEREGGSSG